MTVVGGFLISLIANALTGTSQILQKKALLRLSGEGIQLHPVKTGKVKSPKQRYLDLEWIYGVSLSYLGDALNFVAYSMCNPALLSPLGIVSILTSLVLASYYLNEKISKKKIRGYSFALLGVIFLIISSHQAGAERVDISSNSFSYFSIITSFHFLRGFLALLGLQSIFIFIALRVCKEPILFVFVVILSLFAAINITAGKLVSIYLSANLYHYTLSSHFIGPIMQSPPLSYHICFLLVIGMMLLTSTVLNEVFRQKCLDYFPVVMFYPFFYCLSNALVILASIYFWNDWTDFRLKQLQSFFILFPIGMSLVVTGLIYVNRYQKSG